MDVTRRHQKSTISRESDHLGKHRRMPRHLHQTLRTHRYTDAHRFQHQTRQPRQGAARFKRRTF
ncbi:hypothetical protein D3C72_2539650 [compost metagenome]